ncbi:MAG: hypothetical protein H5T69_08455, partial [Chloroflexi bacterium]|nr:hypothetical protein [Chloroflexota bacterium]
GALAPDHGVPPKDPSARDLTMVWFTPHEPYYQGTILRHDLVPDREYAGRDVFAELAEPTRRRGMKLYARILEGFSRELPARLPNWSKILSIDVYGRPTHLPCWNHPDYRLWWLSTVEDLFKSYPLDGFKWGSERSGPLTNVLHGAYHGGDVPNCFCEHCRAKGRALGIDPERAREGFRQLYELVRAVEHSELPEPSRSADAGEARIHAHPHPALTDGLLVALLRLFLRYPEILAWENLWHESREELAKAMYGTIKQIKPEAQVGWHLYHNGVNWFLWQRAEFDMARMVPYSDWLKPVVYHDIAGPRLRRDIAHLHSRILRELSEKQILHFLYAALGWDPALEPDLDELMERGLSPDFVYRETRRAVQAVEGQIPIYPGLGFDIPWDGNYFPSEPETVYQATLKAFEAGASGLIVSREYDEMRLDNLRAVGRAVRDAEAAGW